MLKNKDKPKRLNIGDIVREYSPASGFNALWLVIDEEADLTKGYIQPRRGYRKIEGWIVYLLSTNNPECSFEVGCIDCIQTDDLSDNDSIEFTIL